MTYRLYIGHIPTSVNKWIEVYNLCIRQNVVLIRNSESANQDNIEGFDHYIEFPSESDAVLFRLTHL